MTRIVQEEHDANEYKLSEDLPTLKEEYENFKKFASNFANHQVALAVLNSGLTIEEAKAAGF